MSMKGGLAGPKKLIVETDEFFDPPGAGGAGQFSPSRYLSTLLHSQDPVMIDKVVKEFESLLGSLSETDIKNLYRKFTTELQDPENGVIKLLGAYPNDTDTPALDREASEAEIELMTALTVIDEYEPVIEATDSPPEDTRTAFKTLLDHAVPALYHFRKADEIITKNEEKPLSAPVLPSFMAEISPDFARKTQQDLNLRPFREIDVTQIINTALADTSRDTQRFGAIELLIPPLLSLPDAVAPKRDTRRDFEEKLSAFRDGALGGLDEIREFIAEIDDPGLKQEFETQLHKSVEQRLEEHRTAQISLPQDEVRQLEQIVYNAPNLSKPSQQPDIMDMKPVPAPVFADIPESALPMSAKPAQSEPEPVPVVQDSWLETLQAQVDKNARKAFELYDLIKEGPSSDYKEPAQQAAKDLASTYTDIQRTLQDYKSERTPELFEALTQSLEKLEELQTPEMSETLVRYDREAALIEAEHRQALEAQQQQISFQMEQLSPKTPDTPEISGPALFSSGGDMGGGFA